MKPAYIVIVLERSVVHKTSACFCLKVRIDDRLSLWNAFHVFLSEKIITGTVIIQFLAIQLPDMFQFCGQGAPSEKNEFMLTKTI